MNEPHEASEGAPTEELIEAIRGRLVEGEPAPTPARASNKPTDPAVYTETDPSEDVEKNIQPGNPGTYSGEYVPVYETAGDEVAEREDLPEGYTPGAYTGKYLRASN